MSSLLRFERVTCRRGGRLLFEDMDLELGAGEALHLCGPNGSGKSSLIRLAAGLLRAEAGRVHRSDVALADDTPALDRELPLEQALCFWAKLKRTGDRLEDAIRRLGLAPLVDVPVRLLSAGQAKRAVLARVVSSGAPLWLLDEPLNGLDAVGVQQVEALVSNHLSSGGAVVAASHASLGGDWAELELGAWSVH